MLYLANRRLLKVRVRNDFSVGHDYRRLDTKVDANTFASVIHFWYVYIATNRAIVVSLFAFLDCHIINFLNVFVFKVLTETALDWTNFRKNNRIANYELIQCFMAHRITVALTIVLGFVSRILIPSRIEVLICLVHIHIGIGESLRIGFLQPRPFFLEWLQFRPKGHLGFFIYVWLDSKALVVYEPAATEGFREEHLLRLVRIQLDFYTFLHYHTKILPELVLPVGFNTPAVVYFKHFYDDKYQLPSYFSLYM